MPTKRLEKITAWSYSRYTTYKQCPAKAKYSIIDKLKEPDSPAGMKGTRVHALAALVTSGKLPRLDKDNAQFYSELQKLSSSKTLPEELECFADEFRSLKNMAPQTEAEWAFTKDWLPCSWFGPQAWLRIKVDLHWLVQLPKRNGLKKTEVEIIDHKTGKQNSEHDLQRSIYALGAFLQYPDAAKVTASHWYLDNGTVGGPDSWERKELEALKKEWLSNITAMMNDTTFAPTPNEKCRWCHYRRENGGPCKF